MFLALSLFSSTVFAYQQLSPLQLHQINNGNLCCYSDEFLASKAQPIQIETTKLLPRLDIDDTTKTDLQVQWTLFWTWQVLDVLTTMKALEFDCIEEVNPLLPKKPSASNMILLKSALLGPAIYRLRHELTTPEDFYGVNYIMSYVIINNVDQYRAAKKQCNRR